MKKERIKSTALVLLVLANLIMTYKILDNKKLWPAGYNFFVTARNKKSSFSVAQTLAMPEKIIVNTGYQSSRFDYKRSDSYFSVINDAAQSVLKKAFSAPGRDISAISAEEWYSVLTAKSVYLSYPCSFSAQVFSEILGLGTTDAGFKSFSDAAISEDGKVYINSSDGFYRISISSEDIRPIIQTVADEQTEEQSVINYSFDLNFDKDFGDQTTFLSPMIAVYSSPIEAPVQTSENPLIRSDGSTANRVIEDILPCFSINPNTVRRYTEADGTLVFVENDAILKLSPEGILSFKASDSGIKLANTPDTYANVTALAAFVDRLNNSAGISADMCVTSRLDSEISSSITFDYIADGFFVKYPDNHAVSVSVSGGYITEYTQILRRFIPGGTITPSPIYIEALDNIIAKYQDSMNTIQITHMFPAYIDDMTIGEKSLDWFIEIDNVIAE